MRVLAVLVAGAAAFHAAPKEKRVGEHVLSVKKEAPKVAKVEKKAEPAVKVPKVEKHALAAAHDEVVHHPVSMANWCIMTLASQFFLLYTALIVIRQWNTASPGNAFSGLQKLLEDSTASVNLAPMMAVLFLAARYRANALTGGDPNEANGGEGLPQPLVKTAMETSTWGILAQLVLVLFRGWFALLPMANTLLTTARYIVLCCVLGGLGVVCHGIVNMKVEGQEAIAISPAVNCTMILSVLYFSVVIALEVARTLRQWLVGEDTASNGDNFWVKFEQWLSMSAQAMSLSPMLALLFITCRIHAQSLGLAGPASDVQTVFYLITYSVLASAGLCVVVPACFNGRCRQGFCEGDVIMEIVEVDGQGWVAYAISFLRIPLTLVRHLITVSIYGGFIYIVVSMYTLVNKDVKDQPEMSTAAQCVIHLVNLYLLVFGLLWLFLSVKQFGGFEVQRYVNSCLAARGSVMFAPMLAVLFVGARLRASEIKDNARPQMWVQHAMVAATSAVAVQLFMSLVGPFVGLEVVEKEDGSWESKNKDSMFAGALITTLGFLSMLAMYGGAGAVMAGIYDMNSANVIAAF